VCRNFSKSTWDAYGCYRKSLLTRGGGRFSATMVVVISAAFILGDCVRHRRAAGVGLLDAALVSRLDFADDYLPWGWFGRGGHVLAVVVRWRGGFAVCHVFPRRRLVSTFL